MIYRTHNGQPLYDLTERNLQFRSSLYKVCACFRFDEYFLQAKVQGKTRSSWFSLSAEKRSSNDIMQWMGLCRILLKMNFKLELNERITYYSCPCGRRRIKIVSKWKGNINCCQNPFVSEFCKKTETSLSPIENSWTRELDHKYFPGDTK